MINLPLVTISIPIYDCENHILNCLQSVINQSYKNLEILLVDDLGNDNSMKLVENFIEKYPDFNFQIYRNEKNSGLSVVRNVGINHAKGKYIFFLDSDDEITTDCISKMVEVAETEQVQMVCGNVKTIRLETKEEIEAFKLHIINSKIVGNETIFESFIEGNFPVPSWNKLILLDFLKQNKLYFKEGLFAQDSLQSFETALVLESVYFLKDDTYLYYLHQDSVIHNRKKKHFDNWITIATEFQNHYQKEKEPKRKKQILGYLIDYKNLTLLMNWKAQKNEELWKYSYDAYKKMNSFSFLDYFSLDFSMDLKKKNFLQNLPTDLGYKIFRKRFGD